MFYRSAEQLHYIESIPGVNGNLGVLLRGFIQHKSVVAISAMNCTCKTSLNVKDIITGACIYRSLPAFYHDSVIVIPHVPWETVDVHVFGCIIYITRQVQISSHAIIKNGGLNIREGCDGRRIATIMVRIRLRITADIH